MCHTHTEALVISNALTMCTRTCSPREQCTKTMCGLRVYQPAPVKTNNRHAKMLENTACDENVEPDHNANEKKLPGCWWVTEGSHLNWRTKIVRLL